MNRNRYAQCSSCFFRYHKTQLLWKKSVKGKIKSLLNIADEHNNSKKKIPKGFSEIASEWLFKSEYQKYNLETLNNVMQISYEEFAQDPIATKHKMLEFCPELETLDIPDKLHVKDRVSHIRNFNQEQIEELKKEDLQAISDVLRSRLDLLDYFGYELI